MNKISLRMRLSVMMMLLLTASTVVLTLALNVSANKLVNKVEMYQINSNSNSQEIKTPIYEIGTPALEMDYKHFLLENLKTNVLRTFQANSIIFLLIIILISGCLTYYLSKKTLEPLNILNDTIKEIDINNLSKKIDVPRVDDEISQLTSSFNHMTDKITSAFESQKRFSSNAAHELRTPLAVLQTKIDVFNKKQTHSQEDYDKLLNTITLQTKRMNTLVENLLKLTNKDENTLKEPIELHLLFEEIVYEIQTLYKDKNVQVNLIGNDTIVYGNYNLLFRAFTNLIDNAMKYNVADGCVDIILSSDAHCANITISDTGVGIPTNMQQHIFEPFFRINDPKNIGIKGSGLGLALVKDIIEKHSGQISITTNLKGGSDFIVTIPIR